jgi:NAD(P)-dependent dehydrogenase (short-subunit alcohol dehydrogenase family)
VINFSIQDQVAVVTGGARVLCSAMCQALALAGAKVAVLDLHPARAEALAAGWGHTAISLACNVFEKESTIAAA